jgi:zinc and cadmium transporter
VTLPIVFSVAAVLSTLAGAGLLLWRKTWAERHIWRVLAFGSGVLLGITFLHLLPEAWELDARWAGLSVLGAFVLFFAVEGFTMVHACSELVDDCPVHHLTGTAFAALFLHSVGDGLSMGFSFVRSATLGLAVSGAVLLHKFSDGITLSSLLVAEGRSRARTGVLTGLLALATPLGVLAGLWSGPYLTPSLLAMALGLAAGGFLYVSTADILPRLHRTRDTLCWVFLAAGAVLSGWLGH